VLFSKCEGWHPNYYDVNYINNASFDIYYYVVDNYGKIEPNVYPDTTILFDKNKLGLIKAKSYFIKAYYRKSVEKIISEITSDTLSVFYFHPDTVSKYPWEIIQHEYKVLKRYDLSVEDIHKLKNKYDVPEIPYLPTAIMKDMKMYPPYGE
jgi:hypothetical protein